MKLEHKKCQKCACFKRKKEICCIEDICMQHMVYKDTYVSTMYDKVEACVEYHVVLKMYV